MKFLLNSVEIDKDTFLKKIRANSVALQHEYYHMYMAVRFGIPVTTLSLTLDNDYLGVVCTVKAPIKRGLQMMITYAPYLPNNLLDMLSKISRSKDSAYKRLRAIITVLKYGLYEILDFIFKLHQKRIFLWVK